MPDRRLLLLLMVPALTSLALPAAPAPTLPPQVFYFYPQSAKVGTPIVVFGYGFDTATQFLVGGVPGTFQAKNTYLAILTIPNGAKTGAISVVTPSGTANSADTFTVTPSAGVEEAGQDVAEGTAPEGLGEPQPD